MTASVKRNTIIYTVGNILPKAAGFFLLPIYTIYLTPAEYGIINSVNVLAPILAVFFSLGFDAAIFRLYWDYKTDEERKAYFSTMFFSNAAVSLLLLAILLLSRNYIQRIYSSIDFFPYFLYMIIASFVSNFFYLPMKYLILRGHAIRYVFLCSLRFALNVGCILFFIVGYDEGAAGYLKAGMISAIAILPVYLYMTFRIIGFHFDFTILANLLRFSLPVIPTLLCAWVINLSDRIFIERFCSLRDVGIYSLSYTIAGVVLILINAFILAYRPVFFEHANMDDQEQGLLLIYKNNNLFIMMVMILVFLVIFFARELIGLLINERYGTATLYIPLIAMAYLFNSFCSILNRFYEQSKKMKTIMYITLGTATVNVALNALLVPVHGAYGAAIATLISFLCMFLAEHSLAQAKCFFVPFNWKVLLPFAFTLAGVLVLFNHLIQIDNLAYSLAAKSAIAIIGSSLFLWRFRLELRQFLKGEPLPKKGASTE